MRGLLVLLLLYTVVEAAEPALQKPHLLVRVRTEGRVALDTRTLARIATDVVDVWRPYAEIAFSMAGREAIPEFEDQLSLPYGDELELVVTDRTLAVRDTGSLGWIEFVNGQPARTITVSTTAARALMEASSWSGRPLMALPLVVGQAFVEAVLSRSIAHEIGHYLLGSREHTARGLMRARFSSADILEPKRGAARIEAVDVPAARIAARQSARPSSTGAPQ